MPCRLFICFVIKTRTTYIDTYITASPTRQTFVCHCLRRINVHQTNRSKNMILQEHLKIFYYLTRVNGFQCTKYHIHNIYIINNHARFFCTTVGYKIIYSYGTMQTTAIRILQLIPL